MSLTSCFTKAGSALSAEDRRAIQQAALAHRAAGMSSAEAAQKAKADQLAAVRSEIAQAAKQAMTQAAPAAPPGPSVLNQSGLLAGPELSPESSDFLVGLATVARDAMASERDNQPVGREPQVDGAPIGSESVADLAEGQSVGTQEDSLAGQPALAAMLAYVRRAVLNDPQILDAVVGAVPVDVVNNLFGSKSAAKVALHDQAMLKDSAAFDADLPVSIVPSDGAGPVFLLVREEARLAAEVARESLRTGMEPKELLAASSASQRNTLDQGDSPRGQLSFAVDLTLAPTVMSLLSGADFSTVVHESGHFFLEVQNDLAQRIQAKISAGESVTDGERGIVEDMNRLLKWFGVEGSPEQTALDAWGLMSLDERRTMHEKFARGFELYSFEGKAPSLALQEVFNRFRSWLANVYRVLTNTQASDALQVKLNDDVRAVMDRMLATDQAIEEAEAARGFSPMLKTAEEAATLGWSLERWQAYQDQAKSATQQAVASLDTRVLKDMQWLSRAQDKALKARQAEVEEQRREIRAKVRLEVYSEPVYQAWQFLTGRGSRDETVIGAKKAGASRGVDPEQDSVLVAIAKLGGVSRESAQRDLDVSADDLGMSAGVFGKPPWRKDGGLNADRMREQLTELGYLHDRDEFGRTDLAGLRAAVSAEMGGDPQYSFAKRYDDASLDSIGDEAYGKLNTQDMRDRYGEAETAVWRKLSALRMTSDKGIESEAVADRFGFDSGDALVKALAEALPPKETIEARTDARMLQEYGDITSPEAMAKAANEAVSTEARARFIASEMKALQEATTVRGKSAGGASINLIAQAAKQYAAQIVGRMRIRDIRPGQFTAAESRNARLADKAFKAAKLEEAGLHKRNQLVNNYAAKAALDAQAEAKSIREYFKKITKGNAESVTKAGRDPDIANAARAVLSAFGVETNASKTAAEYLDLVEANDPDTYAVIKPMIDVAMSNAKPLDQLTITELRALKDEVDALWFLAKRSRQMEVDGDLIDIEDAAAEVLDRMEAIGIPETVPGETGALTKGEERTRQWLQQVPALLRRVEQWAEAKDGKFGGPFLRYMFHPVKDAADRYRTARIDYRKKFQALVDEAAPIMPTRKIDAWELGYTFGRGHNGIGIAELLHAIAHTGNDSNKGKLLLGRGWATKNEDGSLDTSRWDAFIARMVRENLLKPAHYDFVQGVWDLMEQTKPLAQKTHREVFGRYFNEVTAAPFTDPFGVPRAGGYIPAQADPALVQDAELRDLLETENAGMAQAFPATNRGFTQGRSEGYNRPLKLDLRTLPQHIDKVLLFSHMEPAVRGVARLLRQKNVSQPLARLDPAAMGGMLKPWLNRSARQTVETPVSADARLNRMASTVRARVGMALMFANVSNTLQQVTGFMSAAGTGKAKASFMRRAVAQYIANPKAFKNSVWALSPYMADRASNEVAVLSDTLEAILVNPTVYERAEMWTRRHGYFLQTALDNQMSPVIWTAAYNQALADGSEDAMAIRYADGVIRQTQGSTLPEDVSRIETGPAYARLFTQFIGYFNMLANTNATAVQQIAAEQGLKKGAGKAFGVLLMGLLVPIWVAEAIAHAMRGGPEDDDDDGYLDDWLAAVFGFGTIKGIFAGLPVFGQIGQSMVNRFNDQLADDKFSLSPTVSVLESAAGAPASVYRAIVDDGNAQKAVRDVSALITVTTGLPAMAVARPLGYAAGMAQGKVEPTDPLDAARGLVTGVASPVSRQ